MEKLSTILEREGFGVIRQPRNENAFYYILSTIKYETKNPSLRTVSKMKKEICEFEIQNASYFHLFLPQCIECDGTIPPADCLVQDFKQSTIEKRSPSPREIFAASEIFQRTICFYRLSNNDMFLRRNLQGFIFTPVLRNCLSTEPLCVVMYERMDGYPEFGLIDFKCNEKNLSSCPGFLVNKDHMDCFGLRFANSYESLFLSPCFGRQEHAADLFSRFSLELYGQQGHHLRIINAVRDFELTEDNIDLFYKYLTDSSDEEIQLDEKKKLLRIHLENIRSRSKIPGRGELFALSSVFNIDIIVGTQDRDDWEIYMPITSSYAKCFHSPILLRLQQKGSAKYKPFITKKGKCSCCQVRPAIHGNIGMIEENVHDQVLKKPCCPSARHAFHEHLDQIPNSRTTWPDRTECFAPDEATQTALWRLSTERRRIDQINGGTGSLKQALTKELFGDENASPSELLEDLDMQNGMEQKIKSASDLIELPIYVFNMIHDESSLAFYWTHFEPSSINQSKKKKSCRFYITLFHNHSKGTIDRITPISGCNCQLQPPLSFLHAGEECESDVLRHIEPESRHKVFDRYFSEKPNQSLYCVEVRDFPPCSPYSGLRAILQRKDMEERMIDFVEFPDHSLIRCISKEIFGTEEHVDLLLKELTSEIQQNLNVYFKDVEDVTKDMFEKQFGKMKGTEKERRQLVEYAISRMEDDLPMGDLLLLAACTFFQTKIFVLRFAEANSFTESYWVEYLPLRKRADRYGNRQREKEFLTLLEAQTKRYCRIVAKKGTCNCELNVPNLPSKEQDPASILPESERTLVSQMRRIEALVEMIIDDIDKWLKCNFLLQQTCDNIVAEMELRRRNVNIATISGSSTGILGAILTAVGIGIAPLTAGASFALAVAGGVLAATGGTVAAGAKITETVLNNKTVDVLKRYQERFQEQFEVVKSNLEALSEEIRKLGDIASEMEINPEIGAFDYARIQSLPGIIRMVKGLTMIPLAVLRISARGITILGVVIGPLSALIDISFLGFSIWNMVKGNKTDITENLRRISASLYGCRRQMHTWAYGNQRVFYYDSKNSHRN